MNLRPVLALAALHSLFDVSPVGAAELLQHSTNLDIPAQRLWDSLQALAWRMDIFITCDSPDCRKIKVPGVRGTMTVQQALDTLLRGTRLHSEILDDRSIGIYPLPQEAPAPEKRTPESPIEVKAADAPVSEPEVVVTGTHITGVVDRASPITVYTRRTLEESGAGSLGEFLSHLPQNLANNSNATYAVGDGQNAAYGRSFNLFGLGEPGTLVLIDGHRIAPSAMGNFVDISLIPLCAIEQIEVLTDGEAAIYGADAVAGVVNIVLRRDFKGAETDVRNAWPDHSGATDLSLAQIVGKDWGSGNFVSSGSFSADRPLLSIDRSYSDTSGYDLTPGMADYDGYFYARQQISPHFSAETDGLYTNRHTADDINYVFNGSPVGPYQQRGTTNQYSFAPVLKWTLGREWRGVADFNLSENRFTELTANGGEVSPAAALESTLSEARVRTADGRVDGPFASLPGGAAKLALGFGGRWEDYRSVGSVTAGFAPGSFDRHVSAAYGELYLPAIGPDNYIPAIYRLNFSLAVRAERYSDAGSTSNPKFGFTWQPVEPLTLRGTYGTSFATARFSDTLSAYDALIVQRPTSSACPAGTCLVLEEFGASPSYRPERSKSYNIGFDWNPEQTQRLKVKANFYSISYRDQISAPPETNTLLAQAAAFPGIVVPDPSAAFISTVFARGTNYPQGILDLAGPYNISQFAYYIDERTRNLAQTIATGGDFDLSYELPSSYGVWDLGLSGTRILKLDDRASPLAPEISVADTFAHPLSHRYQGRVGLRIAGFAVQLQANYAGSYTDNQVTPTKPVASWTTFDAIVDSPLEQIFAGHRAHLELSVHNLFNRDPPYAPTLRVPDGYDPVNADAMGRLIALRIVGRW